MTQKVTWLITSTIHSLDQESQTLIHTRAALVGKMTPRAIIGGQSAILPQKKLWFITTFGKPS